MKNWIIAGRCFFGVGVAGVGILQFVYSSFRPVILPPWPTVLQSSILAYNFGLSLVIAGMCIMLGKAVKIVGLSLAAFFLILFVAFQFPYILFIQPNSPRHLGLWTDPIKEVAFCGGALVMAASGFEKKSAWLVVGRIFFGFMLVAFGLDHFYYTRFVATLVPGWIPGHVFWTYFAAVCLMGAGLAIILKIFIKEVAFLLGIMLFLWFAILHIPRALADPYVLQGNEITSVFEALAFSGVAFVIAGLHSGSTVHSMTSEK